MNLEELWNDILKNEGNTFYTKTKFLFTYEKINTDSIKIYRGSDSVGNVTKDSIRFIMDNPDLSRDEYRDVMRTSSYALALYNFFNQ